MLAHIRSFTTRAALRAPPLGAPAAPAAVLSNSPRRVGMVPSPSATPQPASPTARAAADEAELLLQTGAAVKAGCQTRVARMGA